MATAAEPATGWRGDGSGKYPAADPPVCWSRTNVAMKGLRFSAARSDDPNAGTPMPDGVIRDWLIAGPVPFDPQATSPGDLPKEAALDPEAGQALGTARWQKVTLDTAYLDFMHLLGKPKDDEVAAFAFTHVYTPAAATFRIDLTYAAKAQLWVNGQKPKTLSARMTVALDKGWNRLLIRSLPGAKGLVCGRDGPRPGPVRF